VIKSGSTRGPDDAEKTYSKLASGYQELLRDSAQYDRHYLERTVNLELPDAQLQRAYDWARVAVIQGLLQNPDLGTGLIAGYRTSGETQRPGFAWFFGRDVFWTSLGLNAAGDFATAKTALSFVGKFQRDDGKIPHEISQAAAYVNWFKEFPYGFASADATPLFIIAMDDYLRQSADAEFVKENWDRIWKAYQFLRSTSDEQGFPKNFGVGHGWVEGGRLLPVKTEFYRTGLGTEALRALGNLARAAGKADLANEVDRLFAQSKTKMNEAFWLNDKGWFAFALDQESRPADELSVLTTVPMWFGLVDEQMAEKTITVFEFRSSDRLGHADHFREFAKVQRRRISLRIGVAAVHRVGVGGGVSVSSRQLGLCEFGVAGVRWVVGACDRGALRNELRAALDEFAAADLVGGDGSEPNLARAVWIGARCGSADADVCAACSGGLDCVCAEECGVGRDAD
jgi:GH15 family glucan-1,4-alpha-glucosidase